MAVVCIHQNRKNYANGRKRHVKSKLRYQAVLEPELTNTGSTEAFAACSSRHMAELLNERVIQRPPQQKGRSVSKFTEWDVRDWFNRPGRIPLIINKFQGISMNKLV